MGPPSCPRCVASTSGRGWWGPSGTSCGLGSTPSRKRSVPCAVTVLTAEAEVEAGREPSARRAGAGARRGGRGTGPRGARPPAGDPEHPGVRRARRRRPGGQPDRQGRRARRRSGGVGSSPAGAALGDRRGARDPRSRAGCEAQRCDVHHVPQAGRNALPCPLSGRPRSEQRPVRGDQATEPRPVGHPHRQRPAARSSPTTPTSWNATTCGRSPPQRSRSPRSPGTRSSPRTELPDAVHGLHALLPTRSRFGRS